ARALEGLELGPGIPSRLGAVHGAQRLAAASVEPAQPWVAHPAGGGPGLTWGGGPGLIRGGTGGGGGGGAGLIRGGGGGAAFGCASGARAGGSLSRGPGCTGTRSSSRRSAHESGPGLLVAIRGCSAGSGGPWASR